MKFWIAISLIAMTIFMLNVDLVSARTFHGVTTQTEIAAPYKSWGRGGLSEEDYERLQSWGINSIIYHTWWSHVEESEEDPGVYNEVYLQRIGNQIQLAKDHGLYPFILIQATYGIPPVSTWRGWSAEYSFDYINWNWPYPNDPTDTPARDRYINLWRYLAQRFPDTGLVLTVFPYHREDSTPANLTQLYENTLPALYYGVRDYTDEYIMIHPMHQGQSGSWQTGLTSGQYDTIEQYGFPFTDDPRLIYGFNNHGKADNKVVEQGGQWDYDYARLREHYAPLASFKEKYDVHFGCIESTPIDVHMTPEYTYRPIDSTRLDWIRAHSEEMEKVDASWWYFTYDNDPSWSEPVDLINGVLVDNGIADVISEYAPIDEYTFGGRLVDSSNNPVSSTIEVDADFAATNQQGYYQLPVQSGNHDVQYNINDLFISDYYIKILSKEFLSDVDNVINYVTDYPNQNKISFRANVNDGEVVETYSPNKPTRVLIDGQEAQEVNYPSQLTEGKWYYELPDKLVIKTYSTSPVAISGPFFGLSSYPRTGGCGQGGGYSTAIIDDVIAAMDQNDLNIYRMSLRTNDATRNSMVQYFLDHSNYQIIVDLYHTYDPGGSLSNWNEVEQWTLDVAEEFSAYEDRVWIEPINEAGNSDLGDRMQDIVDAVRSAGYKHRIVANKWNQAWSSMRVTDPEDRYYVGYHYYFNRVGGDNNGWSLSGAKDGMQDALNAGFEGSHIINTEIGADYNEENSFSQSEVNAVSDFMQWCADRGIGNTVWQCYGLNNWDTYQDMNLQFPSTT